MIVFFPPRFGLPFRREASSVYLWGSPSAVHTSQQQQLFSPWQARSANPTTLDRASDPSTFRSNAFFLSRAQHGRHGRRATDHGQRLRGRPNVPPRRPSPGALRPAAVLTAWRRPLAPTFWSCSRVAVEDALVLLFMMLEPLCVRAFLFFSQVRQRRHPSARLHVQNVSPRHAQRGAGRKAFHGPRRVAVVWRSRRAHMQPRRRRSRTLQRREVHREQGQPRRARGPSAGPGAQVQGMTSPVTVPRASVTPDGCRFG